MVKIGFKVSSELLIQSYIFLVKTTLVVGQKRVRPSMSSRADGETTNMHFFEEALFYSCCRSRSSLNFMPTKNCLVGQLNRGCLKFLQPVQRPLRVENPRLFASTFENVTVVQEPAPKQR